jgi:hypothetical protein
MFSRRHLLLTAAAVPATLPFAAHAAARSQILVTMRRATA